MSKNKTVVNNLSVKDFINKIADDQRRKDMNLLLTIMEEITNKKPKMWGASIVGFDEYHYKYDSGREGDMFLTGCSPRKNSLTIYVMAGLERYKKQLIQLGKHKIGKSCLYIKSLDDVDEKVLKDIITDSVTRMERKYK